MYISYCIIQADISYSNFVEDILMGFFLGVFVTLETVVFLGSSVFREDTLAELIGSLL